MLNVCIAVVETSYPVIEGVVGKSPYGNFVTLYNCITNQTTMNMAAVGSETITCHRAIVGDDHPPVGEAEYESLDLRFTHLDDWVGWRNIRIDWQRGDGTEVVISYTKPEMVPFPIGDTNVKVGYSLSVADSIGHASIKEKAHLLIEPMGRVTAESASDEYSYRLQNLLTFATDTPNEVEDSLLRGELVSFGTTRFPKSYYLIYKPVYRLKGPRKRLRVDDMLFSLGDAREAGLNIFQNWFDFVQRHEAFFILYFAHLYSPPKYQDDAFRNLMTEFTLLCRSGRTSERTRSFLGGANSSLSAHYDSEEQVWLNHALPDEAEVEMPFHLLRLLQEHGDVMGKVIEGDFKNFVALVCRSLAFVSRRTIPGGQPILQGPDLFYATERIRWLIKAIMLKELGFNESKVKSLIEKNTYFNHLRTV